MACWTLVSASPFEVQPTPTIASDQDTNGYSGVPSVDVGKTGLIAGIFILVIIPLTIIICIVYTYLRNRTSRMKSQGSKRPTSGPKEAGMAGRPGHFSSETSPASLRPQSPIESDMAVIFGPSRRSTSSTTLLTPLPRALLRDPIRRSSTLATTTIYSMQSLTASGSSTSVATLVSSPETESSPQPFTGHGV
ncbi:hypothetical protein FRB91_006430 [Serendipita sp. 411]|nr:hypothetical protein FRC15_006676 [Serendipita sp. 397]KAG8770259.1 hypothetical protein FRC16_006401 [Serendipita sp. 398]KAG8800780.1 hypothetical protein FRC18_007948 [Serendipita sp. 400]KAG8840203.1 hypothetical protein FRB91_006430 [Serendipita sp. 411]